jgi:hypothetical protein
MNREKPVGIKILSIILFFFGIFAFVGSIFLWGAGFILSFPEGIDYSFPVVDIFINAPTSIIAALGLWKLKRYGYIVSQFVAGFYIYASGVIFVEVAQNGPPYPLEIIGPQILAVLVAIALIFYLWRLQELFA